MTGVSTLAVPTIRIKIAHDQLFTYSRLIDCMRPMNFNLFGEWFSCHANEPFIVIIIFNVLLHLGICLHAFLFLVWMNFYLSLQWTFRHLIGYLFITLSHQSHTQQATPTKVPGSAGPQTLLEIKNMVRLWLRFAVGNVFPSTFWMNVHLWFELIQMTNGSFDCRGLHWMIIQ